MGLVATGGMMDTLASQEVVDHILEHHGIKGMKWGVRTRSSGGESSGSGGNKGPREVTVKTRSSTQHKTMIRTKGGENHPAHPDAVAARMIQQKLKKSGMNSLSNKELQDHNTRLQLEQNASRLTPPTTLQRGMKHVTSFLKTPQGQETVAKGMSQLTKKRIAKGAAKVAVTTAAMAI